ncbi:MAG: hypothetical protein WBG26_15755, partial [Candidatus Binataceae bacterium]
YGHCESSFLRGWLPRQTSAIGVRERTPAPRGNLRTQKNHGALASVADMQGKSGSYRTAITEGATRRFCASSFRVLFIAICTSFSTVLPGMAPTLPRATLVSRRQFPKQPATKGRCIQGRCI